MGSVSKVVSAGLSAMTFGSSNALGINKMVEGVLDPKMPKVATTAAADLATEKEETAKRRKALLETSGGILGEEVESVGGVGRGTLFGN